MTNDLQAISDGLRVKLLGEDVEYPEHDFRPYCTRCGHSPYKQKIPCRPDRPLLSADPEYQRVLSAMESKRYAVEIHCYAYLRAKSRRWTCLFTQFEEKSSTVEYREGATIGEAIVRAAFAALVGE